MAFRRGGPKRASKIQQKKLVETAKELAEDPMKVIPECQDNCWFCKFGRAKRKIKKIEKYKDNEKKLKKLAKRGPDLSRALAGTLLLAISEEAPLLATTRTPQGEISFAKRGKASKNRLIGVQHFDDPKLRLMAYSKEAKKGFYFYSWGDRVVCTGKNDDPPKEFVKSVIGDIPYKFEKKDSTYVPKGFDKKVNYSYFALRWDPIDVKFIVSKRKSSNENNLFTSLSSRFISKDNSSSFSLRGEYRIDCVSDCNKCRIENSDIDIPKNIKEAYFNGEISDREFINHYTKEGWNKIKEKENIYAIDGRCYGKNMGDFLSVFSFEEWEEGALRNIIEKSDGIILDDGTVNELLNHVWSDLGKQTIRKIIGDDQEKVDKIYEKGKERSRPRELIKRAREEKKRKDKLSSLPDFKKLPPKAKFAHEVVKRFKTEGKNSALQYINDTEMNNTKMKSVAFGFLEALGEGDSRRWKYDDSEVESGEFMAETVEDLIDADGEDYAELLQHLLKISGSTAKIETEN